MKTYYCFLTICLLFERTPVESEWSRSIRLHRRRSCLQMCGRTGALRDAFPAECIKLCRLKHRKDLSSKVHTRRRKNLDLARKQCSEYRAGVPVEPLISHIFVTFMKDENDSWVAVVRWNPQDDVSRWEGYKVIYSDNTFPPNETAQKCIFLGKNETQVIIHDKDIWNYPHDIGVIVSMYGINSSLPFRVPVYDFGPTVSMIPDPPSTKAPTSDAVYLAIFLGVLCGLIFVSLVMWEYRRRTRKRRFVQPSDFQYDAFIIYSSLDNLFVDGLLLPLIEEEFNLTCCIHHRDFTPGESIHQNMADSVSNSRKIITVVSKHFLESNYCHCELQMALQRLLEWRDNSVLVIKLDNADRKKLPLQLRGKSFIDYSNLVERCSWKNRLHKFLAVQTTPEASGSVSETHEIINNNERMCDT